MSYGNKYDGERYYPDVLEPRWFCNGDLEGLPFHTQAIHSYWSVENELDKKHCYRQAKEQIRQNKVDVGFAKYPSISSAICAAKDLFHSFYQHKKFQTVQECTFNKEKLH